MPTPVKCPLMNFVTILGETMIPSKPKKSTERVGDLPSGSTVLISFEISKKVFPLFVASAIIYEARGQVERELCEIQSYCYGGT